MSTQNRKPIVSKWSLIAGLTIGTISWISYKGHQSLSSDPAFAIGELIGSVLLIVLLAACVELFARWIGRIFSRKADPNRDPQPYVPANDSAASDAQRSNKNGFLQKVWPTITDKGSARDAVVYGFWWYVFSLAVTALVAVWSIVSGRTVAGYDGWSLVDASLLAIIAWRIWRNSRAWAVIGLAYESINVFYKLSEHQSQFGILAILIYLAAITSVRGTFAFHKHNADSKGVNPIAPNSAPTTLSTQNISSLQDSSESKGIAMFVPEWLNANAFRVLRLPSTASLAAVHRAAGDMRRAAVLDTIVTGSDDVPVLGGLPNSEAAVRAAVGRIENPELRIRDRLFWFHSDKASTIEKKTFFSHDLVLKELFAAFAHPLDEASVQSWSKALESWQQIVSDDDYWAQISELEFEGGFEPAAFPSEIEELRGKAVELAAEPLVVAGREAVGRNDTGILRLILTTLGNLNRTGSWAKSAQLEITSPLVERFKTLCKSLRAEFEPRIVRRDDAVKQNAAFCAAELARFRANVLPELDKLTHLLPPGSETLQEAREEAALLLSAVGSDFTWADEFIESEKLYEEALKLAENTLGSIRIQTALEGIRSSAHQQRVRGKSISSAPTLYQLNGCGVAVYGSYDFDPETGSYATNYYFTLLWLPILPIARYRVINAGDGKYQFLGKLPLRNGDRWHLGIALSAIAIALVIAMVSSSDSRSSYSGSVATSTSSHLPSDASSTTASSPDSSRGDSSVSSAPTPAVSPTSYSSNDSSSATSNDLELSELRQKIEAGRSEMKDITNRLKPVTDELSSINNRMKFLKSEIDNLKQQQDSGTEIDTDHYNSIVDDYNGWLTRKKALLQENEPDFDRLDALQKADDDMLRQWKALGGNVE